MDIELAISPCPNDTYIFYELARAGFGGHTVSLAFADVEELNRRAIAEARHAVTKLSCFTMHAVQDQYRLLRAGGALGRGCGPLLIRAPGTGSPADAVARARRILIPGRWTTAAFLTRTFLDGAHDQPESIELVPVRYDRVMPELERGTADLGVIIHEERFTYSERGLELVADLGAEWESTTGFPIPLGCIAARRDLDEDLVRGLEQAIAQSLDRVNLADAATLDFIRTHSQSLEDDVIRAHIELYVNDYSRDMGLEGERALAELFRRADKMRLSDPV